MEDIFEEQEGYFEDDSFDRAYEAYDRDQIENACAYSQRLFV